MYSRPSYNCIVKVQGMAVFPNRFVLLANADAEFIVMMSFENEAKGTTLIVILTIPQRAFFWTNIGIIYRLQPKSVFRMPWLHGVVKATRLPLFFLEKDRQ